MSYRISLLKKARKFIESQPKNEQIRILTAINKLPETGDIKPVSGRSDTFRLRVGNYRVIYTIQENLLLITVINVGNRGQIYKNL